MSEANMDDDRDAHTDDLQQAATDARRHTRCEAVDEALARMTQAQYDAMIAADYRQQRARRNADEATRLMDRADDAREEAERVKREHGRWRGDK